MTGGGGKGREGGRLKQEENVFRLVTLRGLHRVTPALPTFKGTLFLPIKQSLYLKSQNCLYSSLQLPGTA